MTGRRTSGFTVLEILITLVIVAMFSTAIYAVFLRSLIDTRWVEETVAAGRLGQSVLKLFERDLAGSVPASGEIPSLTLSFMPSFMGSISTHGMSSLEFISAVDSRSGDTSSASDLVRITYLTIPNDDEEEELAKLYRREERSAGRTPSVEDEEEYVLLEDRVKNFDAEYFDGTDWLTIWNEADLPRAVRIKIVVQRQLQTNVSREAQDQEFSFTGVIPVPGGS